MAKIVKLHHNISLSGGVMGRPGVAWGCNALQTVTIARHTPFNPQQAVGYKGIVDYTSSPVTSDLTLDCILTENSDRASTATSVYNHADTEVIIGTESYVLTSCNINFQAGNPATVNYGYITAGLADALLSTANPAVLKDGEEAAFAIVMGEDGQGVCIIAKDKGGSVFVIPPGVQTLGFTASLNRNQILDVRSSSPIQFVTTYPLDLSVNLEELQHFGLKDSYDDESLEEESNSAEGVTNGYRRNQTAKRLDSVSVIIGDDSNSAYGLKTHAYGNRADNPSSEISVDNDYHNPIGVNGQLVRATGLMLTEDGESVNVGGNLTFTYNYTAADIEIPLYYEEASNSGSGE